MKDVLRNLLLKLVGCPYVWGGGNPWTGLDCSGFTIWVLQVFGILPGGDWTAAGLCQHFKHLGEVRIDQAQLGDLVFYNGGTEHITHVMIALGGGLCVGASGGGPSTLDFEEARRIGAAVKVKPIRYRSDLQCIVGVSNVLNALESERVSAALATRIGAAAMTDPSILKEAIPRP